MGPNDDDADPGTEGATVDARTVVLRGGGVPAPEPEPDSEAVMATVAAPLRGRPLRPSAPLATIEGDRYKVGELIGKGGMGEVLAAHDNQIGRGVAIKRMRKAEPSPGQVDRFLREARIQGRLDHPAIAPVHELARDRDGRPYFVMKRVAGTTLVDVLIAQSRGDQTAIEKFPRQRLLRAFADVCLAIEFAHNRGVVHRDLKPNNIMLGDFGEVYVLDWGIARVLDERERSEPGTPTPLAPPIVESDSGTLPGSQLGTPGYMAPEQAIGDPGVDGRADVYALGCVLFEILAGEPIHPHVKTAATEASGPRRRLDPRPSVRRPDREVPPELETLCVEAMQRDPDRRLSSARELGERVQRYLDGDRDLARRQELAREHLSRATAALDADTGVAGRKTAMSAAGRALALDPSLAGAADLVSRLMVEPPPVLPREVADAIAAEDRGAIGRSARISALSYLGYLVFIPIILAIGVRDARYTWATLGLIVINFGISWVGMRGGGARWRPIAVILTHVAMISLLSRMFTPPLVAPGAAAVITMALLFNPSFQIGRRWLVVVGAMLVATIAPYFLEMAGVLQRTMSVVDGKIQLESPAIMNRAGMTEAVNILWTFAIIVVAAAAARVMGRAERDARRRLHIQSWQLRQLMPDPAAG